jgi:hypothetical protein
MNVMVLFLLVERTSQKDRALINLTAFDRPWPGGRSFRYIACAQYRSADRQGESTRLEDFSKCLETIVTGHCGSHSDSIRTCYPTQKIRKSGSALKPLI